MDNILEACDYSQISKNTKILSKDQLDFKISVHLPLICKTTMLYQINNISKSDDQEEIYLGDVKRDGFRLWLDINLEALDLRSGKHTYKMYFSDRENIQHPILYFAYIIQDDNPKTPYIYMPDRGNPVDDKDSDDSSNFDSTSENENGILVSSNEITIEEGESTDITLRTKDDERYICEMYTVSSSDTSIAKSSRGNHKVTITGVSEGSAVITVHGTTSQYDKDISVNVIAKSDESENE